MKCHACGHEWKLPGPQAGGLVKVAKGFAVAGQPSAEARKRGWKKRKAKAKAKRSPNSTNHVTSVGTKPTSGVKQESKGGDV